MSAAKKYLSLGELSKYCSLSVKTLRGCLIQQAHPLPHYRIPGKILGSLDDFETWMQCCRQASSCPSTTR